jgi:hypothetical protein
MKTKLLECCFGRAPPRYVVAIAKLLGRRTSGLLYRVNLGAVLSVMLRLVMNPEGCAECLWHVEMWANTKIMVGPANWHYYLV